MSFDPNQVFMFVVSLVLLILAVGFTGFGVTGFAVRGSLFGLFVAFLGAVLLCGSLQALITTDLHESILAIHIGFYFTGTAAFVSSARKRHRQEEEDIKRLMGIAEEQGVKVTHFK